MRKSPAQVTVRQKILVAVLHGLGAVPVLLVLGLCSVFVLLVSRSSLEKPHLSERELERAVEELRRQGFRPGMHLDVALPHPFRPMTKTGTVDLVKTTDGRMIVLFKTSLGWKGNYRGIVFSDAPLKPEEIGAGLGDSPSIMIDGLHTFIRKRIHRRHYEVFFDLG